ncbi:MAG: transcription elongation factor GreA [candidate division Zixibacteria bacterium]
MSEPIYLTKEGRLKMEAELKQLKFEERPAIIAEIKRARELGDLSENAEYHAAKEKQGHVERKIAEVEEKLSRVRSVDTDKIPKDKAYLFSKVLIRDERDGEEILYTLASSEEADVDNDIISVNSPIGKALLGKAVGDKIEIKVPAGLLKYEIISITRD